MPNDMKNGVFAPLSIPVGFLIELSETNDKEDVFAAFARWVRLILDCERISILFPVDGESLERVLVEDNQIVQTGEKTPLYGTTLGEMFRLGQSAIMPDVSKIDTPDSRHVASLGYTSAVMAPVSFAGQNMGLLAAVYRNPKKTLDEDLLLLESMGRCLASHMLLHEKLSELSRSALTDPLTKVHNRRSFQQLSSKAMERWEAQQEIFSLLICDLDHFKKLNDTYGHDFGDEVLCAVSDAMQSVAREGDYVVRMGGEEFCILMTNTKDQAALSQAEAVRAAVAELKLSCEDETVPVTTSVGVAKMTPDIASVRELIIAADQALYEAKQKGRNRVVQAA